MSSLWYGGKFSVYEAHILSAYLLPYFEKVPETLKNLLCK